MFLRTYHIDYGIQFHAHQNKEFGQILYTADQEESTKSITLKPGHEYEIEITPIGQETTHGFRNLPYADRNCKLDGELNEGSIFKIYSKANCMYECEVEQAYKYCDCIPWDFFHQKKSQMQECDVYGRTCFHNMVNRVTKERDACHHCDDECDKMDFHLRIINEKNLTLEGTPYVSVNYNGYVKIGNMHFFCQF